MTDARIKTELVRYARALYQRGWVANHDGNVSVRVGPDRIWATPTAVSKEDVTEDGLVLLDIEGRQLEGTRKVFSEINLHLAAYRARDDVKAVVHAHPPVSTAFACAGVPLPAAMMPEAVVSLGATIPTVPYASPGPGAAAALLAFTATHDAMLLDRHGVLAFGRDVEQAYLRMELVEHYARIAQVAMSLGALRPLPAADVEALLAARAKAGLGPQAATPSGRAQPAAVALAAVDQVVLLRLVTEEVTRALRGG